MSEATFSPDSGPTRKRRRCWRLAGALISLLFTVMVVLAYYLPSYKPGIQVTVQNTGSQPIRSVVLFVTGNKCSLGDIPPGAADEARVKCTGDSHLEIEFVDHDEQTKKLDAGGFFQPGYRGKIRLTIRDGTIQENEQDIEWWAN